MADARSDDLDEDFVVFQRTQGQVLHLPVFASLVVGTWRRGHNCACRLGRRHALILLYGRGIEQREQLELVFG